MTAATSSKSATDTGALDSYLRVLVGRAPSGRLLEIRFALRHRDMGRLFLAAHSAPGASRFIRRLAVKTDVYVGVCLRNHRAGGRDAIDQAHLAYVDIDAPDAIQRLRAFRMPPTMIVSTGTAGHAHAYFALSGAVSVPELERANRCLAEALGGDLSSVDCARILRPPLSWNHKYSPPTPVQLVEMNGERRYWIDEFTNGANDQAEPAVGSSKARSRTKRTDLDRLLLAIPAVDYVYALTGRTSDRNGKLRCPFHDDHTPSLQLYDDGTWYCFGGCRAGGSIYDFASRALGLETKGRSFLELRQRLAEELLSPRGEVGHVERD